MPSGTCDPATRGEAWNFAAQDEGPVKLTYRYGWDGPRTASVTKSNGTRNLTAGSGPFTANDVGRTITGTGIPAGTRIATVTSATAATMTVNATSGGTITATIGGSEKASSGGCIGPLGGAQVENTSTTETWYAHFKGRRGNPRRIDMPPGFFQTYGVAALTAAGFLDNTDMDGLRITNDPTPPAGF